MKSFRSWCNFIRYFSFLVVLFVFIVLRSEIVVHASGLDFNLSGDDIGGGDINYKEGISPSKSGWMVYIVDANGNKASPDAKFISSNGYSFSRGADAVWDISSRLGGYSIKNTRLVDVFNAPWGAPFSGSFRTRESEIRAWMSVVDASGISNAQKLIQGYWGQTIAESWVKNDYYLVLEPIYEYRMWYRYNVTVTGSSVSEPITHSMQSKSDAPVLVGNAKGLAKQSGSFLSSLSSRNHKVEIVGANVNLDYKYMTGFTHSGMSSGYAKAFPRMEFIYKSIGGLSAGSAGSGYLSLSQIQNAGWGILAISAHDSGTTTPTDTPDTPSPDSYDGYFYTLSCTGGSGSTSASATFGGTFYADSSASGTDAYNLANRLKGGI